MPDGGLRRVTILSAIRVEYQAVRAHLTNHRQEMHSSGTVYERGDFTANGQSWDVLIGETGVGNAKAAAETVRAIEYFKPSLILFVGVAGGLKDVKLGDVVAATKVYGYESGKADPIFRTRPDVRNSTHRMEQRARAEAKKEDWFKRLKGLLPDPDSVPRVHVAPIASGNQVAASTDSAILDLLRSSYGDAVAVEMEGYGFLEAAHAYSHTDALIIRGISDLIDDKPDADAKKYQEVAARHASAFAFEILAKLDTVIVLQSSQIAETSVTHEGGQEGEVNQHETTTREEPEMPSTEIVRQEPLDEFRVGIPEYSAKIRKIHDLFNDGKDLFPDRCESAIKMLDGLDDHVQTLRRTLGFTRIFDRVRLGTIHDQMSTLKSELQTFRRLHGSVKTSVQRREYESSRKKICTECETLLTHLDQFKRNP